MSTITLINQTNDAIRIAIYTNPVISKSSQTIAWRVASPPPGGQSTISFPANYEVFAEYSNNPNEAGDPQYQTNKIIFGEYTARFDVNSVTTQDGGHEGAFIEQTFNDLVMNEMHLVNNYGLEVTGHITRDGQDVYAPQMIRPGGRFVEDIRSTHCIAVVGQFTYAGDRLVLEEVSLTETPIHEGQTAIVSGSVWAGYTILIN